VWAPHLVVGLAEIAVVLMTRIGASEHTPISATPAHR
jgi:hypothetical protein